MTNAINKNKYFSNGSEKLRQWYNSSALNHWELKKITGVSRQAFSQWMLGKSRPSAHRRILLEQLTKGSIKADDWILVSKRGKHGNDICKKRTDSSA